MLHHLRRGFAALVVLIAFPLGGCGNITYPHQCGTPAEGPVDPSSDYSTCVEGL